MTEKLKISIVYLVTSVFILLNTYLVIKEFYWGILIPMAILLVLLYIFSLDKVIFLAVFSTPLAIDIGNYDLGANISVPSEPLLFGVMLLFILKLSMEKGLDKQFLRHPVTIAVFLNLAWLFITSCASDLPVVSFKFLMARLWFIIPLYFAGSLLFKKFSNIKPFAWAYVISLVIVIGYATYNHSLFAFSEKAGHWVMTPFYNDHTAYGAILALFLPIMAGYSIDRNSSRQTRILAIVVTLIIMLGLFLSASRAAWVSFAFVLVVLALVLFRIRFTWILLTISSILLIFFTFQFEILDKLEKNKQDSSANFIEHIQSISNISTDASNLERINRWQSALRMYHERPFFGWGPGTYQFEYAPFQRTKEKTIISTNLGDMGNAHSEYIGPLAEQGFPGLISFLLIMITVIYTGLKVFRKAERRQVKMLALVITLGLITYFVHGTMNNFLNTDKASVPFWGFVAILVAMDLYHSGKNEVEVSDQKEA
ncbi:MAG: O-antigen ligase family protein [Bacteroidales bacterium]|nr:O-antigen ligase family protein [Bacteroidales bacterium]